MKLNYNSLFYALLIFSVIGCNGQKEKHSTTAKSDELHNINSRTMKKMDTEKFERYNTEQFKYVENDSVYKLEEHGAEYKEIKSKIGENLSIINVYDKNTLVLTCEGKLFGEFPLGLYKNYDLKGNLISEKNFDDDYAFSLEDLKQKMISEFKINIDLESDRLVINRGFDKSENKNNYTIRYYSPDKYSFRYIMIDGTTGQTVYDKPNNVSQ